jgi:hypothetical protein
MYDMRCMYCGGFEEWPCPACGCCVACCECEEREYCSRCDNTGEIFEVTIWIKCPDCSSAA